ncbi:hypothetical protein [Paraburkholderia rhizosphaerae]|uniref:hypothetical protein n=1 Tax=Paraburkholderia rhizosphaerae TaxID=480658 RepID=UPI001065BD6C|nr:hypothetical protein [Paraburkholderia rhizosphaerae]
MVIGFGAVFAAAFFAAGFGAVFAAAFFAAGFGAVFAAAFFAAPFAPEFAAAAAAVLPAVTEARLDTAFVADAGAAFAAVLRTAIDDVSPHAFEPFKFSESHEVCMRKCPGQRYSSSADRYTSGRRSRST